MKKVVFLFLALFAFLFVSCSEDAWLIYGEAWVAECEHGSLKVKQEHDDDYYHYTVTAFPDEGYCLKAENLYVVYKNEYDLGSQFSVTTVSENVFTFSTSETADIIISAYFTKKESN